jgi:hypothetical protein
MFQRKEKIYGLWCHFKAVKSIFNYRYIVLYRKYVVSELVLLLVLEDQRTLDADCLNPQCYLHFVSAAKRLAGSLTHPGSARQTALDTLIL